MDLDLDHLATLSSDGVWAAIYNYQVNHPMADWDNARLGKASILYYHK